MATPTVVRLARAAISNFFADKVPRLGAALSYYTLFAIAPMLLVVIAVAGWVFGTDAVRGEITQQIEGLIGREGAEAVQAMLRGAARDGQSGLAMIVGAVTFLIASTGAFFELQGALNKIWRVKPKKGFRVKAFLLNRAQSFALVLGIGFLLMVSLALNAALSALSEWMQADSGGSVFFWNALNALVSLVVISALFAAMFKVLPDVQLRWREVAVGASATAVLFTIGKHLIGLYLGHSGTASAYGAAGSVVVLMLWVYYTSQILLLGAEFTRVHVEYLRGEAPATNELGEEDRRAPQPA